MSEILSENELQMIENLHRYSDTGQSRTIRSLITSHRALQAERDTVEQRLREVCQSHGTTLIHMHDLEKERDALKAELAEAMAIAEEVGPLVYDCLYLQVGNNQEAKDLMLRDPRFQKAAQFIEKHEAQP